MGCNSEYEGLFQCRFVFICTCSKSNSAQSNIPKINELSEKRAFAQIQTKKHSHFKWLCVKLEDNFWRDQSQPKDAAKEVKSKQKSSFSALKK